MHYFQGSREHRPPPPPGGPQYISDMLEDNWYSRSGGLHRCVHIFAAASTTLYYRFEPKFYANFRQSEVFLNCNIHHTS